MKSITYLVTYSIGNREFSSKTTTVEGCPMGASEFYDCARDYGFRHKLFDNGEIDIDLISVKEIELTAEERVARLFLPGTNRNITIEIEYHSLEGLLEEIFNFLYEIEYAYCGNPTFSLPYGYTEYEYDMDKAFCCFFAPSNKDSISIEEFASLTFKPFMHYGNE